MHSDALASSELHARLDAANAENRRLAAELSALREEHRQAIALQVFQQRVLEMVARGESLPTVLEALVRLAEVETGMRGSVLLLEGQALRHGAAPSLPADYNAAIDGLIIGPGVGSCGTAAHAKETVIVEDIATHPYWAPFKALAMGHGLRACWSHPVVSAASEVLGTFALYYDSPRSPDEHHLRLVATAAHLAGIAIEREQGRKQRAAELKAEREARDAFDAALLEHTHALQAQRATLRAVLDSATSGIRVCEAVRDGAGNIVDFRFTLTNATADRIAGIGGEDLTGHLLLDKFPSNRETGLFDLYVRTVETGLPAETEVHYRDERLDFWVHVSAVKLGDGVAVTFSDITERKQAEDTLRQQAAELTRLTEDLEAQRRFAETLVERLPAGVAYIDQDFVFRVVNPTMARFYGKPLTEVVGLPVYEVLPGSEKDIEHLYGQVRETLEPLTVTAVPVSYRLNGEERLTHWDATIVPYLDPRSAFQGWLVLALEVSERQQLQAERDALMHQRIDDLERANVHKEQFLSILSHELRTPINAIMGFASVLDDGVLGPTSSEQRLYLSKILAGSDRLLCLINDLLDMSRIQAGMFSITPGPVDLAPLCEDTLGSLQPLADQKQVALSLDRAPGAALAWVDAQRIEQVLTNLVGNAIKFTPQGGRVTVAVRLSGPDVRVEVRDTGIGISPEHHARIFEAFTQVDMSNTRRSGGAGLGLAIAKSLIEAHQGTIGLDSVEGQGATFWFTLPQARETTPPLR